MSNVYSVFYATLLLVLFVVGVALLVRYMRTRRRLLLVLGLLFTFVLPGLLILAWAAGWLPMPGIVYAPPPHFTPPQPTATPLPTGSETLPPAPTSPVPAPPSSTFTPAPHMVYAPLPPTSTAVPSPSIVYAPPPGP